MHTRIKQVRKNAGLNQRDFGERISVKQQTVTAYECGNRVPIDAVIASICKAFNVREDWLRNGEGEMYNDLSREEEFAQIAADLFNDNDQFKYKLVKAISKLNTEQLRFLKDLCVELANEDD